MSRGTWLVVTFGALAAGCGEPPPMVAMTPPGMEANLLPPGVPESKAQAIGEGIYAKRETEDDAGTPPGDLNEPTEPGQVQETDSGLKYETIRPGTGEEVARFGDTVSVLYTGYLAEDGEKGPIFDSTSEGQPVQFTLAEGQLIQGWLEGMPGMRVGEVRRLIIPPELAYGSQSQPGIPPDSTLIFEIELMDVQG